MRRTRIKGIANIPQRKKGDQSQKSEHDFKSQLEVQKSGDDLEEDSLKIDQVAIKSENIVAGKEIINEIIQKVNKYDFDEKPSNSVVCETVELAKTLKEDVISVLTNVVIKKASKIENSNFHQSSLVSLTENDCEEPAKKPEPSRRRAIKPSVSVGAIRRTDAKIASSENIDKERISYQDVAKVQMEKCVEKSQPVDEISEEESVISLSHGSSSNNKVTSTESEKSQSPINISCDIKKPTTHANVGSDCECPPLPPSPNKLNRSRIKAIPRVGYRKINFSASESEDESKKVSYRKRNDSQSSNFSGVHELVIEQPPITKMKEFSSVIQRKCKRTEWSRKLAEARREFTRKFMSGKPDHKKLTMIDLIFYNPATNVMKNEKNTISEADSKSDLVSEEEVDNPSELEENPANNDEEATKKSDEENEVPVPQIRIGPSGEIILDEKSLVIENKQTKINREQLQKSRLIDGNSDRPYGVFKKVKRSKDWTHSETLRFYKALSTIGTDFSLMCELFPNRTRRELKMKFKKEEKINQQLIDKAVMEPCSFDFEELKKEFELVEIEKKELEHQRIKEDQLKKNKGMKKSIKFLKFTQQNDTTPDKQSVTDTSRVESDGSDGELQSELKKNSVTCINSSEITKIKKKHKKPKISNYLKKNEQKKFDILSVLSESDSASSDYEDSEIVWRPVQTRYGRKTRKRQIYEPDLGIQEEFIVPRKIKKPDICNDQQSQQPGSLMMISSKTPDGQPIVQIFMVTDKKVENGKEIHGVEENVNTENLLPIAMIKTGNTDDEEEEELIENNYTIPAEPQGEHLAQKDYSEVDEIKNVENKIDETTET